jgi:DNA primase large subunit
MNEGRREEEIYLCLYPFLSAASKYVEELGVSLEDLISSAAFERARLRGKERIIEAIKAGEVRKPKPIIIGKAQTEMELELLSYPFARILVSCVGDDYLVRRYSLSEAKAGYKKILEDSSSCSNIDVLRELSEEFGIRVDFFPSSLEEMQLQMPFVDYLKFTSNFRDKKWKLMNRRMEKGMVKLRREEFVRIIQEAIYERIKKDLPLDVPRDICEAIKGYVEDIKRELGERRKKVGGDSFNGDFSFLRKDPSCFPPCISHILNDLKEGVNVSHSARFAVTSFLLNIGMNEEEIIDIYQNSPDFDEDRTRYQVNHIAGSKGRGSKYTAPSCATMLTYGNCVGKDEDCEKVSHPLSYYKMRLKWKRGSKTNQKSANNSTSSERALGI